LRTAVKPHKMHLLKRKDGFLGELQINIPRDVVINQLRKQEFLNNLFITHIGFFPSAKFHYRERPFGCPDNILIYCVEGKGLYQTETESYTLQPNQFFILPPGRFHIYQADIRDPWSIYWVHFSGNMVKSLNKWLKTEHFIKPTNIAYDKRITEQWAEMFHALEAGFTEENLAYANLCLYRFLTFFLCPPIPTPQLPKVNHISESVAYMKSNIGKLLSVHELAAQMNYSSSHYTSVFKKATNVSPIEYFINLKIHYASQLLSQTELRVNEIAGMLGYEDSLYFSRLFKKLTGRSPKDFRNAVLTGNDSAGI
jgi:AraC-like DNA-binding protein/quercetin dioxygenase-like cupin family protein